MSENLEKNRNEDKMKLLISAMRRKHDQVKLGGGKLRIEKEHAKGKLTARERIEFLLDKDAPQLEIGAFAGDEMYAEHGGCPSGGVVVVMGYIKKRQVIVVANDATVKAGLPVKKI
jgi:3-methylcrotonyl-CoA carboxylase beta subunit